MSGNFNEVPVDKGVVAYCKASNKVCIPQSFIDRSRNNWVSINGGD